MPVSAIFLYVKHMCVLLSKISVERHTKSNRKVCIMPVLFFWSTCTVSCVSIGLSFVCWTNFWRGRKVEEAWRVTYCCCLQWARPAHYIPNSDRISDLNSSKKSSLVAFLLQVTSPAAVLAISLPLPDLTSLLWQSAGSAWTACGSCTRNEVENSRRTLRFVLLIKLDALKKKKKKKKMYRVYVCVGHRAVLSP